MDIVQLDFLHVLFSKISREHGVEVGRMCREDLFVDENFVSSDDESNIVTGISGIGEGREGKITRKYCCEVANEDSSPDSPHIGDPETNFHSHFVVFDETLLVCDEFPPSEHDHTRVSVAVPDAVISLNSELLIAFGMDEGELSVSINGPRRFLVRIASEGGAQFLDLTISQFVLEEIHSPWESSHFDHGGESPFVVEGRNTFSH
ncbi:hypothetical protein PMAYCL1PPCAC_01980 [Pristionchus mayeri]|uniref:Uncharacterized protein n=1 Tax=Pristionchus mayeri TaxID=1317129 RepID=A0AAN4Z7B0_9BILA|nr:hypothetical protein PMAYCL1PPCAC_01980 [Pristionchus mayeri]